MGQLEHAPGLKRVQTFFDQLPHGVILGLEVVRFEVGVITARLPYRPELVGNPWNGALHGGAITTLIDQSSAAAASAALPQTEMVATLDLRIDYLRQAEAGKALIARAQCYRLASAIAFVRCEACEEDDMLPVATSVSSFMRVPALRDQTSVV